VPVIEGSSPSCRTHTLTGSERIGAGCTMKWASRMADPADRETPHRRGHDAAITSVNLK
jgi:hypothetical protein